MNKKPLAQSFEPKWRLCVGGHLDPHLGKYEAASPTALSLAHSLLLRIATTLGWTVNIADVTAAFLQGLALPPSHPLYVSAPSGCPPSTTTAATTSFKKSNSHNTHPYDSYGDASARSSTIHLLKYKRIFFL